MNPKNIILIISASGVLFLLVIITSTLGNFPTLKYSLVQEAFTTGNFEDIEDPAERDFYLMVYEEKELLKEETEIELDIALIVSTFTALEKNETFTYSNITREQVKTLLENSYVVKKTLICISTDVVVVEEETESLKNKTIDCEEDEICTCGPGYEEAKEDTVVRYKPSVDKYYQHLATEFIPAVLPDYFAPTDEEGNKAKAIEIRDSIKDNYEELLETLLETDDISFFLLPIVSSGCRVTSPFGMRVDPVTHAYTTLHKGIDVVSHSLDILAARTGVVTFVRSDAPNEDLSTGYGNVVFIEHDIYDQRYVTVYAHLVKDSVLVELGQVVRAGTKIATMGTSGHSTGVHLHFEIRKNDEYLDPVNLFINRCIGNFFRTA